MKWLQQGVYPVSRHLWLQHSRSFWAEFVLTRQTVLKLQHHLTRGVALRLHYTPSNCISTQQYIELVSIHKTTKLRRLDLLDCVLYFQRQYLSLCCEISMLRTSKRIEQSPFFSYKQIAIARNVCRSRSFLLLWWIILEAEPARIYCYTFLFIVSIFSGHLLKIIHISSSAELHRSQESSKTISIANVLCLRLHM